MKLKKIVARAAIAGAFGVPGLFLGVGAAAAAPAGPDFVDQQQLQNGSVPGIDLTKIDLSQLDLSQLDLSQVPTEEEIQQALANLEVPQIPSVSIPTVPVPPLVLPPPDLQLPEIPPPGPRLFRMPWEPKMPWELF